MNWIFNGFHRKNTTTNRQTTEGTTMNAQCTMHNAQSGNAVEVATADLWNAVEAGMESRKERNGGTGCATSGEKRVA